MSWKGPSKVKLKVTKPMGRGSPEGTGIEMEWLGLRQLSRRAPYGERTIRSWIHSPVDPLPAVKVKGKILVRKSVFDDWLERHAIKPLESIDVDGIVQEVLKGKNDGR